MDKFQRIQRKIEGLPVAEKRAIRRAMQRPKGKKQKLLVANVVTDIVGACCRTACKRRSDADSDARRRTLVGAHVRRENARRYREAATASGRSLYRFTADALEAEVQRLLEQQRQQEQRTAALEQRLERAFDKPTADRWAKAFRKWVGLPPMDERPPVTPDADGVASTVNDSSGNAESP